MTKRKNILKILFAITVTYAAGYSYWVWHRTAEQFQYDWDRVQTVFRTKGVTPLQIRYNQFTVQASSMPSLSSDYLYTWQTSEGIYHFRSDYISRRGDTISFHNIRWFNHIYPRRRDTGSLSASLLPRRQKGKISVVLFGDTYWTYGDAHSVRPLMKSADKEIIFLGRHTGLYGYPHEACLLAGIDSLLHAASSAPPADYYIVFTGLHDEHMDSTEWRAKMKDLLTQLAAGKARKQLYVVSLPPVDSIRRERNRFLKNLDIAHERLIPLDSLLGYPDDYDLKNKMPSQTGYEKLAAELVKRIKQHEN